MTKVNIWLDDVRPAPEGWLHVYTSSECISALINNQNNVSKLSLDHDLGDDILFGTGYNVASWLEESAYDCYSPIFCYAGNVCQAVAKCKKTIVAPFVI